MKTPVRRLFILTASVISVLVVATLVVLPVAAAVAGPALLRQVGVRSEQLSVRLSTGLDLLGGTVDSLTISSGPLEVNGRFSSADATVVLNGANLANNTFASLTIDASEPVATMASGEVVRARSLHASGPADAIVAEARFSAADLLGIVSLPAVAARLGLRITDLTLRDGLAVIRTPDGYFEARLSVDSGRLLLTVDDGAPKVIWSATGPDSLDWRLTGVSIKAGGVSATARFDGAAFLSRYPSLEDLLGGFVPAL
jgi:hypothetical protein